MLNIAITFDYELFLGKNYASDDEILFSPTEKLLNLLNKYDLTSTFFADVLSVFQHKKFGLNDYAQRFTNQLSTMKRKGHDVQLHIHSNWLKSTYSDNDWEFDTDSYRMHYFGFDRSRSPNAYEIIKMGKEYLEETLIPVDPNYRCVAYRAGGYCIQPYNELIPALRENGIMIDSSISLHQHIDSGVQHYDFTDLPDSLNWWISSSKLLSYEGSAYDSDTLYEVPIGYLKNRLLARILFPDSVKGLERTAMKGSYISLPDTAKAEKLSNLQKAILYSRSYALLSFDSMPYKRMIKSIENISGTYGSKDKEITIAIICHPKLADEVVLDNMENFIRIIKSEPEKYKFVSLSEVYDKVVEKKYDK